MDLLDDLKRHEGFSSHPYRCPAGVLTIGYGFTYLTREEAHMVLKTRVKHLRNQLLPYMATLSPARQDVLVNMAFNLGVEGLFKFRRMWAAIRAQNFDLAATEMLDSKWARQVGGRAKELSEKMRKG
ncbi:glycoside hydrolase family protein [Desulforhopalus singaporensis]|uniref:Lysozyme n=1 Tax=Desulforhopalus singaporensis TaxID=91360 RepID=A0A1H0UV03_9BACT|nr:glycoside hydrolase family protein [Desulforhopalus singaporensis]SDP70000.1 lysozyme [Desulforhopalus singaporensis]